MQYMRSFFETWVNNCHRHNLLDNDMQFPDTYVTFHISTQSSLRLRITHEKRMRVRRSFWVVSLEALKMNGAEWLWTSWNLSLSCWRTPVNRVTEVKMWGPQGCDKVWIASTLTIYLSQVTELIMCGSKQADWYTVHTTLYTPLFVFMP